MYHNRARRQNTSDRGDVVSQGYPTRLLDDEYSDRDYRT
jgi:hypothetical protein